jgi:hypothetical protein
MVDGIMHWHVKVGSNSIVTCNLWVSRSKRVSGVLSDDDDTVWIT